MVKAALPHPLRTARIPVFSGGFVRFLWWIGRTSALENAGSAGAPLS
jgi:hypothetical protein